MITEILLAWTSPDYMVRQAASNKHPMILVTPALVGSIYPDAEVRFRSNVVLEYWRVLALDLLYSHYATILECPEFLDRSTFCGYLSRRTDVPDCYIGPAEPATLDYILQLMRMKP